MRRNGKRRGQSLIKDNRVKTLHRTSQIGANGILLNDKKIRLNESIHRKGAHWFETPVNIVFVKGGLGDYINWLPALEWIAEQNPQVKGRLLTPEPFLTVAKFVMAKYPHWECVSPHQKDRIQDGEAILDGSTFDTFINATGAHLLDLGFMYYCDLDTAPEGYNRLPRIDYKDTPKELLPTKPYAVITTGHTTETRKMPANGINELVNYTLSKGITPVFLGKVDFAKPKEQRKEGDTYFAKYDDEIDFSKGIDLREKTSLLEATQIMGGAKYVLGIDNGLLHFAGCTDVPIIFGHTITTVRHRDIRRPNNFTINIAISEKDLACSGCQSRMRFIIGHRFDKCLYEDYKCIQLMFANNAETWKRAIDTVLKNVRK